MTTRNVASVSGDVVVTLFGAHELRTALPESLFGPRVRRRVTAVAGVLSWLEPAAARAPLALAACVGTHAADRPSAVELRGLGAAIERVIDARGLRRVVFAPTEHDVVSVVEGIALRAYGCEAFAQDEEFSSIDAVQICCTKAAAPDVRSRLAAAMGVVEGINYGRELADLPANVATPSELVARAKVMAAEVGLRVRSLGPAALLKLDLRLLHGVGAGATDGARLLVLEHRGAENGEAPIVFVGKGITHDTGGYNLKRDSRLHDMSYDKTGATAVLGAMRAIATLALPVNVVALLPLAENGIGPAATKPGDIVRAANGLSVCIENTDAEGRLVLADALHYATSLEPRLVVDIASLTAAANTALGEAYAALFSNDAELEATVRAAGEASGELVWPMPIHEQHVAALRHSRAHLRNVGGSGGEACVAAAFLRHFVDFPWAHIDMAMKGLSRTESTDSPEGATGFGTRLLVELAGRLA